MMASKQNNIGMKEVGDDSNVSFQLSPWKFLTRSKSIANSYKNLFLIVSEQHNRIFNSEKDTMTFFERFKMLKKVEREKWIGITRMKDSTKTSSPSGTSKQVRLAYKRRTHTWRLSQHGKQKAPTQNGWKRLNWQNLRKFPDILATHDCGVLTDILPSFLGIFCRELESRIIERVDTSRSRLTLAFTKIGT